MKTKITAVIMSVCILLSASFAVFASDYVSADYDFENKLLVILGDIGDGVHMVTVSVYKDSDGSPVYVDQTDSSSEGIYSVSIPFDVLDKDTYSITVSSDNLVDFHTVSKFFDPSQVPSGDVTNTNTPSDNSGKDSQKGGGGGSSVSVSNSVLTTPTVPDAAPVTGAVTESGGIFADVPASHWAHDGIEALANKGIINGVGNGMYVPDSPVTREQFAKMLIEAFGLEIVVGDTDFTDVDENSWSYPYLISAYKYGVMNGYSSTQMGGSHEISRQDMAVMVWRMLDIVEKTLPTGETAAFADDAAIADYAKTAVSNLQSNSIISGMGDNMYMPALSVNRAMAAVIIYRTLNTIG